MNSRPPTLIVLGAGVAGLSSALYLLAVRYVAGVYGGTRRPRGPIRGWKPPAGTG